MKKIYALLFLFILGILALITLSLFQRSESASKNYCKIDTYYADSASPSKNLEVYTPTGVNTGFCIKNKSTDRVIYYPVGAGLGTAFVGFSRNEEFAYYDVGWWELHADTPEEIAAAEKAAKERGHGFYKLNLATGKSTLLIPHPVPTIFFWNKNNSGQVVLDLQKNLVATIKDSWDGERLSITVRKLPNIDFDFLTEEEIYKLPLVNRLDLPKELGPFQTIGNLVFKDSSSLTYDLETQATYMRPEASEHGVWNFITGENTLESLK